MKIGIDARSIEENSSGVGRYLSSLLRYWKDEKNVQFFLYFKNIIPSDSFLNSENFIKKNLKIKSNALFTHWFLPLQARKDRVDILFSPGYILPIFWKRKSAVAIHDVYYEAQPDKFSWQSKWDKILLKWVSRKSIEKANLIFVPSEFTKKEILKYYKIKPKKIICLPLGVSEEWFDKNKKDNTLIFKKYNLEKDKYLIYFASIFNRRHLPECINAFKLVAKKLANIQFLIIGENHTNPFFDIDKLIKEINNFLRRTAIIHINKVDFEELITLVGNARVSIYLSDYEGFGLPPLESAACGTPVIVSNFGSLSEVMADAAVYIKDPFDIKEIAGWIYLLFTDNEIHKILKEKGKERAKNFNWENCAKKTLEELKGIVKIN